MAFELLAHTGAGRALLLPVWFAMWQVHVPADRHLRLDWMQSLVLSISRRKVASESALLPPGTPSPWNLNPSGILQGLKFDQNLTNVNSGVLEKGELMIPGECELLGPCLYGAWSLAFA